MTELALHHPHSAGQWALTILVATLIVAAGVALGGWIGRR